MATTWNGIDSGVRVTMKLKSGMFLSAGAHDETGVSDTIHQSDERLEAAIWIVEKHGKGFKFQAAALNKEAGGADHWTSGGKWWLSRCKQVSNWDASEETIRVRKSGRDGWFSLETDQSGGAVEVYIARSEDGGNTGDIMLSTQHGGAKSVVRVTDGNQKDIYPDGTFVVNGETLGTGRWISESRFSVQVANWGGLWWVGELTSGGMATTCVREEVECADAVPDHAEMLVTSATEQSPVWPENNRNYWADKAYQLGGSQARYDVVLAIGDPRLAREKYQELELEHAALRRGDWPEHNSDFFVNKLYARTQRQDLCVECAAANNPVEAEQMYHALLLRFEEDISAYGLWPRNNRNYWADKAYQLGGSQARYDVVLAIGDPRLAREKYQELELEHNADVETNQDLADLVTVKLSWGGDMRRVAVSPSFEKVCKIACSLFRLPSMSPPSPLFLEYTDNEGDVIRVGSDMELEEALRLAREQGKTPRLSVIGEVKSAASGLGVACKK